MPAAPHRFALPPRLCAALTACVLRLPAGRERMNAALTDLEQALTDPNGLPGRDWYRHMIYASGLYTGYGVKTLPGIREAIEERRWEQADRYIGVVSRALNAYSERLDRAIAVP